MKDWFKILIILIASVALSFTVNAQKNEAIKNKKENSLKKDNLNQYDAKNKKQGTWFYKKEPLRGEPGYMEFGNYLDDKRTGIWYKLDLEGMLVSMENFYQDEKNGSAHYYEKGSLVCLGNYRGGNHGNKFDTVVVVNINDDVDTTIIVPAEAGSKKHGIWRYYDPKSGQLIREEEYQVDYLIYRKDFHHQSPTDSLLIEKRKANLPHLRKNHYKPPAGKVRSYTY